MEGEQETVCALTTLGDFRVILLEEAVSDSAIARIVVSRSRWLSPYFTQAAATSASRPRL